MPDEDTGLEPPPLYGVAPDGRAPLLSPLGASDSPRRRQRSSGCSREHLGLQEARGASSHCGVSGLQGGKCRQGSCMNGFGQWLAQIPGGGRAAVTLVRATGASSCPHGSLPGPGGCWGAAWPLCPAEPHRVTPALCSVCSRSGHCHQRTRYMFSHHPPALERQLQRAGARWVLSRAFAQHPGWRLAHAGTQ